MKKIIKHIKNQISLLDYRNCGVGPTKTTYLYDSYDINLVNLYKENLEQSIKNIIDVPFIMNSIWYQIYEKNSGSFHDYHTHGSSECHVSGIYYLQLKDRKTTTEFFVDGNVIQPDVSEGDLILFDSNTLHRSPPNNSNYDKIIISFNLNLNIKDIHNS